jgi:hypothetical protein
MAQIIIADASPRVQYTVGGTPTTGPWSIPWPYFSTDDIKVYFDDTLKEISTHYTISGTAVDDGFSSGSVTAGSSYSNITVTIERDVAIERIVDFPLAGVFNIGTLNTVLDKLFAIGQWLEFRLVSTVNRPSTSTETYSLNWPDGATSTSQLLSVSTSGLALSGDPNAWLGGNGSVSAPYYTFASDTDLGFYRIGANNLGLTVGGTKLLDYGAATLGLTGALTTSGIISVDDATESTSGTTGSIHTDGGLGVAKKLHVIGTTTHGGDVLSDTDSTDSLGSTGVRWLKLWVDSIQTTANTDIAGNLTVTGNLTVNGTTVTNDATNTEIKDPLIELNSGATSNANDLGLLMERGSTGDNIFMGWDESGDYFGFGTTTATADSTGNISYSLAQARFAGLNLSGTSADLGAVTTIDINGGTVDGAVIGGAAAAAITGTTLTANTSITLATGGAMTGVLDSDAMSGTSAALLSTSESIKAYVDNNAPENGVKFAFESTTTDTDQGAGKVWLNNGTPSSASVLYVDDVEAGGVSVNAWVDTWDDVSNSVARGYIYIASYGITNAILVYKITGSVSSASTYSKCPVSHILTVGTISDGDSIGLTFVPSGADGSGDMSDPTTTRGDIIARGASAIARLAVGSANTVLQSDGTDPAWGTVATAMIADNAVTGAKLNPSLVAGDIIYADGTDTITRLAKGSDDEVLTLASGVPSWAAAAGGGGYASVQVFTSNGTWSRPTGILRVVVLVTAGGGGGGGTVNDSSRGGGAGGGTAIETIDVSSTSSAAVTVGAAGAAGASGGNDGGAGGASSFASFCSATGGAGGEGSTGPGSDLGATAGGTGSGGDINLKGGDAYHFARSGASNGSYNSEGAARGGGSYWGPGGVGQYRGVSVGGGTTGTYGTGGGGSATASVAGGYAGAVGGAGIVVVYEYK